MKKTTTYIFFLFFTLLGFSQNRIVFHGRVLSQENPVKNADVINFTTKKSTLTNENGDFYIDAKIGDQFIVISKDFLDKRMTLLKFDFEKTLLIINLEAKPIELDDVKIRAKESVKNIVTYEDLAQIRIAKENSPLRNTAVYDGKIINGMDFVQIGKMIGKGIGNLFRGDKEKYKKPSKNIDFKEYANSNFSDDFYTKTLELKPDDVDLFLNYCEADPKAKETIETEDEFIIMDFLVSKKADFDKMLSENKN